MRQQGPIDILFLKRENNKIDISLNNRYADFDTIVDCCEALKNFVSTLTKQDIDNHNREVEDQFILDERKSREDAKRVKKTIPGWVYIYKSQELYKIGRSRSEDCRVKKYITENPHELVLIHKAFVDDYIGAEKDLHETFADRRHSREWFRLDELDIETIKKMYA